MATDACGPALTQSPVGWQIVRADDRTNPLVAPWFPTENNPSQTWPATTSADGRTRTNDPTAEVAVFSPEQAGACAGQFCRLCMNGSSPAVQGPTTLAPCSALPDGRTACLMVPGTNDAWCKRGPADASDCKAISFNA